MTDITITRKQAVIFRDVIGLYAQAFESPYWHLGEVKEFSCDKKQEILDFLHEQLSALEGQIEAADG